MSVLNPLALHLSRDRGIPSDADFAAAGYASHDGSVLRSDCFMGLVSEFGIVGRAYDKKTGNLLRGRFLVQWTEIDGEVLHHTYRSESE